MIDRAVVRVPATTSNLGAGFDCVGVAVGRWLTLTAAVESGASDSVRLYREGTLTALPASPHDDLIVSAFTAACAAGRRQVPHGLLVRASSGIPVARGLGSSAAAVVAGAAAANVLLRLGFDDQRLLELCASIEGHPDNVVPAIHGGAMLAVAAASSQQSGNGVSSLVTSRIELHPDLALALVVPDFEVETALMRAVLPAAVPHAVAVRAAALAAALVAGLTRAHAGLLELALDDVLHVPFRRGVVRGYDAVVRAARLAGAFGATLSGSGSTVCGIAPRLAVHEVAAAMVEAWRGFDVRSEAIVCETPATGYSATVRRERDDGLDSAPDSGAQSTA
ncbi:MAG TPA: homoserine kinase [Gemmatimonadaceae bacterium]|nr:homoserine kinase [Gemmatimonadaceae bacterium]